MNKKNNLTDFEEAKLLLEIWKLENTIEEIENTSGFDFKEKKKKIKRLENIIELLKKYFN